MLFTFALNTMTLVVSCFNSCSYIFLFTVIKAGQVQTFLSGLSRTGDDDVLEFTSNPCTGDDVLELTSVPSYTGDVYLTLVPLRSRDEEVLKVTLVPSISNDEDVLKLTSMPLCAGDKDGVKLPSCAGDDVLELTSVLSQSAGEPISMTNF